MRLLNREVGPKQMGPTFHTHAFDRIELQPGLDFTTAGSGATLWHVDGPCTVVFAIILCHPLEMLKHPDYPLIGP